MELIRGEIILGWIERRAELVLFLLTKKLLFLMYQDKDILATDTGLLGYPGNNDKTHLFTKVITARAGNLSLHIFQNYHENIFSELNFRKDTSLSLILMYAVSINTQALSGTDLRLNQNIDKQYKLNLTSPETYRNDND